jgi:hypothetical protein
MATPVYGKQFIRFAETGYVPENTPLKQFRVVGIDLATPTEPPTINYFGASSPASVTGFFGVLQQDVDIVDPDKATTGQRLGTVATSGLLLVEAGATLQGQGDELKVDTEGRSDAGGALVEINSTSAIVRQVVAIGGVTHVLASFN